MQFGTGKLLLVVLVLTTIASGKNKPKIVAQDDISVASHINLTGSSITQFTITRHYDRSYVYAERGPGQPIILLDITNSSKPILLTELEASADAASIIAASGTAALAASGPTTRAESVPTQTIRIMDYSDTAHPKVKQQFENVTAVEKISESVTLLANPEGIWVLVQHLADDPQVDERYRRKIIYGESMY